MPIFNKLFPKTQPSAKEETEEPKVIWTERPKIIKKKFGEFFKIRPIVVMIIIGLLAGAFGGAVAGYVAGHYSFSKLIAYFPTITHPTYQSTNESEQGATPIITPAGSEELNIVSAVKKASPAVVSIVVSKYVSQYYGNLNFTPFDDFFNQFFGQPSIPKNIPNQNKQKQEVGGGTGFIISSDGLVLTNKHVVSDEEAEYTVVTNDGAKYAAQVLARDPFNDIAILKIDTKDLPVIQLGDSSAIQIGQTVIAIGNALGEYKNTVTRGVVSAIGRKVIAGDSTGQSEVLEDVIQTDAAINFGNSGGPLINTRGEVIGINTAVNQQGQLIGFAIPINQVKQSIESVKQYGKIVRPFLGVRHVLINSEIAKENNLSVDYGALVLKGTKATELAITPGSPADKAGLVENDIILEVKGVKITEDRSLTKEIQKYKPGDEVELKILHKGEEKTIKVKLEEYK